jgi:hypothetical protein
MADTSNNRYDIIIIIILSLMVSFFIGFNIINLIDSKLSAVTIHVPPQKCQVPPIYLTLDKDNTVKHVNISDAINKIQYKPIVAYNVPDGSPSYEHFGTNYESVSSDNSALDDSIGDSTIDNMTEDFANLPYNTATYDDSDLNANRLSKNISNRIAGLTSSKVADQIINSPTIMDKLQDPDFNNLNNMPLLISPDPKGPNQASSTSKGYYTSRVKLQEDPNSPLSKLAKSNYEKLSQAASKCAIDAQQKPQKINGPFDGYNAFVDLRTDSYGNVSSIGKGLLTPYTSFPVPS